MSYFINLHDFNSYTSFFSKYTFFSFDNAADSLCSGFKGMADQKLWLLENFSGFLSSNENIKIYK